MELAAEVGYPSLPTTDPAALGPWFVEACDSGSLERYLETFEHTVGVMQTPGRAGPGGRRVRRGPRRRRGGLRRGPLRPRAARRGGLSLVEVVEAVQEGFAVGSARAAAAGHPIRVGTLLTAMRHAARSREIAELAVAYRDAGVVGFDIAGAEAGFPPTRHLDAFEYLRRENAHFTIHAGEAFGLPSIWEAIQWCGADRLGHGVRIVDDVHVAAGRDGRRWAASRRTSVTSASRSSCARRRTSRPGRPASMAEHPIGLLADLKFRVTVNTDNRLMSGTSMTREFELLAEAFGYDLDGLPLVHGQRDEVRVPPLRRAARPHRRRHQARLRRTARGPR